MLLSFNPDVEIVAALERDGQLDFKKKNGKYLSEGVCPSCGKRELFIAKDKPWVLKCNRTNNCNFEETTRQRYSWLFEKVADRFPATAENRQATADAYMQITRGFPLEKIRNWYTQESYYSEHAGKTFPTVRFYFDAKKERYWERLIDAKKGEVKQRHNIAGQRKRIAETDPDHTEFNGTLYKGEVWQPPGQVIEEGSEVWWVEGIFHAIALHLAGHKVIAALAANNYPELFLREYYGKKITWVLALDDDKAGRGYMRSHINKLREKGERVITALVAGGDWDDHYRDGKLTDENSEQFFDDCLYRGAIFMAESATEVAMLRHQRDPKRTIDIFHFNGATWCATIKRSEEQTDLDHEGESKLINDAKMAAFKERVSVEMIADFWMEFSHSEINPLTDEAHYIFIVSSLSGVRDYKIALKGEKALESPQALDRTMLATGLGLHFKGKPVHLTVMRDRLWFRKRPPLIITNQFLGYDKTSRAYLFPKFAYCQGRRIEPQAAGFFEIGKHRVKTGLRSIPIVDAPIQPINWFNSFYHVFDKNGVCALAFWLGSLFAEQIRERDKSFFILEMSGAPGTGKSTLIEFLWTLLGRNDCEGIDPNKATGPALARHFMQLSNMPTVLMEGDREEAGAKKGKFDFNELKSLYNGRSPRSRGVANNGVDTDEPPFRGAVVIEQNASVNSSPAVLSRICHLDFIERPFTSESRKQVKFFEQASAEETGGFLQLALKHEADLLAVYFERTEAAREWLRKEGVGGKVSGIERVIKCHGQLIAMLDMLWHLLKLPRDQQLAELYQFVLTRARSRANRLVADHPLIEQFWDGYHALLSAYHDYPDNRGKPNPLNHSDKPQLLAINLPHVYRLAEDYRIARSLPALTEIKALLSQSTQPKFVASNKQVRSAVHHGRPTKCWIFEAQTATADELEG